MAEGKRLEWPHCFDTSGDLISHLFRLADRPNGAALTRSEVFLRTIWAVAVIAGVTHAAFLLVFCLLGVKVLAWANVLSILTYVAVARLVRVSPLGAAIMAVAEVILHGLLAVFLIGWESGFHFYLILIVPIAIISNLPSNRFKVLAAVGTGGLYLLMDGLMRQATPVYALKPAVINVLHAFNLAGMLVILSLLTAVCYRLVVQAEAVLRDQACTDPLTQLKNRRFVMELAQHEAAVFAREGRALSLILCDVDNFKSVNDKHGHQAGDEVLQAVAQVLQKGLRAVDHVARWGGEEFLLLLPGTDLPEAQAVAERLRAHVAAQVCTSVKGPIPVTVTMGLTQLRTGETVEFAMSRADQALYKGKAAGRNRVETQ